MGGALGSEPFRREEPGGRFMVVIRDVEERKCGSDMSDLLIDFLRLAGMRPWLWKPWVVGVVPPDPATGDGCGKEGVELMENGVTGDGLGETPISISILV